MNERKRKMNKEHIEEALELCRMLDEDVAVADWVGCSEDTGSYITNSRIFLKNALHDLELERNRVTELEEEITFAWKLVEQQAVEALGIFHGSLVATNPDVDAVKSILADLHQTAISAQTALKEPS